MKKFITTSVAIALSAGAALAAEVSPSQLADLSLETLLGSTVTVSSVARRPGSVQQSSAAVTIITQEDVRRAGATSIPEALRLVPGMQVARVDSHEWAVSSRGFNDLFANKLLVMMDGRSVYTSLFSGTFWDVQDTMLEDVERIEVVRGPGASLWGANAVNGVINVITKKAENTQGWLISGGTGDEELALGGIRYGGKLGDYLHYRVYGRHHWRDNSARFGSGFPETLIRLNIPGAGSGSVGSAASPPATTHDGWEMSRAGFRLDWSPPGADIVTWQGDIYAGREHQTYQRFTAGSFRTFYHRTTDTASGGNLIGRWAHRFTNSSQSILQVCYDRTDRELAVLGEHRDTFDLDFQHQFALGDRQTFVWGAGYRRMSDHFRNSIEVALDPLARTTDLFSAFGQDEITLVKTKLGLTLGARLEENDFTGLEVQPNARLLWTPNPRTTLWSAVSRAVRTPSRAEEDFRVNFPGVPTEALFRGSPAITIGILGNRKLKSEKLLAYEAGCRAQLSARLSVDLAVFYNDYAALRSFKLVNPALDFTKSPVEINSTLENAATGETYGGELSANVSVTDWWRVRPSYSRLKTVVHSSSTVNLGSFGSKSAEGTNPGHQAALRSWMDLPRGFQVDTALRHVSGLPALTVPAYTELDLRIGWRKSAQVEFSLVGQNLLDRAHPEFKPSFFTSQATEVQRSLHGKVTFRF
jgi:iron complex outermembrane recepter protein